MADLMTGPSTEPRARFASANFGVRKSRFLYSDSEEHMHHTRVTLIKRLSPLSFAPIRVFAATIALISLCTAGPSSQLVLPL